MPLTKSLTTTTSNSFLLPVRIGGITSVYVSANTFTVDSITGLHIGDRFKATGGADRYGTISDIAGLTVTAENISDANGVTQILHASMTKVFLGYNSDVDAPINFPQVVNSKATAKKLKVRSGRILLVAGADGGEFYGVTGAGVGTHVDDGGAFCGLKFIPTGGDGSSVWQRRHNGIIDAAWYGVKVDGVTNDTVNLDVVLNICNLSAYTLTVQPGTCLLTPGGLTKDVRCSVYAPYTIFKCSNNQDSELFRINYSESLGAAWREFHVNTLEGQVKGVTGTGHGLRFTQSDYSRFIIRHINSFKIGLWLDGSTNNAHIACNNFEIGVIDTCNDGILITAGNDSSHQTELNIFNINYIHHCSVNQINIADGGALTNISDENVFNIGAVELNLANANGFFVSNKAERNTFNISGILGGDSGTGKLIIAGGIDNIFKIPVVDWTKISDTTKRNHYFSNFVGSMTFTATLTGCTTTPTVVAYIDRAANAVTIHIPGITGISNTTAATITGLPVWAHPTRAQVMKGLLVDNGNNVDGFVTINTSGLITLYPSAALGGFAATASKGVNNAVFTYLLN